ncbi:MAG: carboxypeptidase-like regulatory domain-containing protein, partial [Candidatus Limnocylindria bacterium]
VTPAPEAAHAVSVLVLGPAGRIAEAGVCAERPGREELCATSAKDGRATLELVAGTYAVSAMPPEGRRLEEGVVTVDIGSSASVVVTMRGLSRIAGTVRDPEGRGVGGAEVCAHAATSPDVECVRSAADGTYIVETPPGIHKLHYTGPADGSRLMAQWARGRLDSGEADLIDTRGHDVEGVDVTLVRGVVLSGTITARNSDAPLEAAQVCTYTLAAPVGWQCEATDRRGRYNALREPGRYWVWTIPPDVHGSRLIPQRYDSVLVGVDATPFPLFEDRSLDMSLTQGLVVSGRVTTSDGSAVVLGLVCVDTPFPTGRICRGTGDDGSYEVATRPETYLFSVVPPGGSEVVGGYWPGPVPDWTKAERIPVRADRRIDMTLPAGVRLHGTVRNARGAPVEAATVNVNDASGPRFFGVTDIHGRYSVAVLAGTYTVDVFAPRAGELLSVVGRELVIEGEVGYDLVMPDVVVAP